MCQLLSIILSTGTMNGIAFPGSALGDTEGAGAAVSNALLSIYLSNIKLIICRCYVLHSILMLLVIVHHFVIVCKKN